MKAPNYSSLIRRLLPTLALLLITLSAHAQQSSFNLDAYKLFLSQHQDLTYPQLQQLHPQGNYLDEAPVTFSHTLYADTIQHYYNLSKQEMQLLERHSFMVTDRVRYDSFGNAFYMIFKRDLPVYVSNDAILHALHKSYSAILQHIESEVIKPNLANMLRSMHRHQSTLNERYGDLEQMRNPLRDVDLYLTVALKLLDEPVAPYYEENTDPIADLLDLIDQEKPAKIALFSEIQRDYDFSQFTPRGHYADNPTLTSYFQAMIWLGRTEFYLTVPASYQYNMLTEAQKQAIGRRQTAASYLLLETLEQEQNLAIWKDIEEILRYFVGSSDNVTPLQLNELKSEVGLASSASVTDSLTYLEFRGVLESKEYAGQQILSQILMADPMDPESIKPASAFMLFGQRFVIDSFITGKVVYDQIPATRMLPQTSDVLFALGNNFALQELDDDIETYKYADELAALRYLVDHYGEDFWYDSFFNGWLQAIRTLNPPHDASGLPEFAQTNAWNYKSMNTQMASWAELRHDNLLYAKQSYTGGIVCSYPFSYVEPNPDFFEAISRLAQNAQQNIQNLALIDPNYAGSVTHYFERVEEISTQLATIAQKEIDLQPLTDDEQTFLKGMLFEVGVCGLQLDGWYLELYFYGEDDATKSDMVVADIHTSPTDEFGNPVGWVKHVGTGPLNLAVLSARDAAGRKISYVGPVMSYYEHVSTNFKRLTDEEWKTAYENEPSMRPAYIDQYLYESDVHYNDSLFTAIGDVDDLPPAGVPSEIELRQNYPNPFNAGTIINFRIPKKYSGHQATLVIINVQGQKVATLIDQPLQAGNYTTRWEPQTASGTYFYRLQIGDQTKIGKMTLLK